MKQQFKYIHHAYAPVDTFPAEPPTLADAGAEALDAVTREGWTPLKLVSISDQRANGGVFVVVLIVEAEVNL